MEMDLDGQLLACANGESNSDENHEKVFWNRMY